MVLSEEKIKGYTRRLLMSRMRLLCSNGFYGLLIMHMTFALEDGCETAATDGRRIIFDPAFLDSLSDDELDFILMHEILHVALQHCSRGKDADPGLFNTACDIVVNSNILKSCDNDVKKITLREYGESMHLAPDGKEGSEYTVEQVYKMLMKGRQPASIRRCEADEGDGTGDEADDESGDGNSEPEEGKCATGKPGKGKETGKNKGDGSGDEADAESGAGNAEPREGNCAIEKKKKGKNTWDDHSKWKEMQEDEFAQDLWIKRIEDAAEAIQIRDPSNSRGLIPGCAERLLKELKKPQTDWRTILNDFIQEEVTDYSFMPPDRRMEELDFFLPDFNEKDIMVADILFMIDTSGSMSDDMITAAYSEVKGAIDQFDGKLKGWLGFFDAEVVEPKPFEDEEEFQVIHPLGGGGTDFGIIFQYVRERMIEKPPVSIIILTDGFAPFPEESAAMGIPVLWLLNNEKVEPEWGRVARIKVEDE